MRKGNLGGHAKKHTRGDSFLAADVPLAERDLRDSRAVYGRFKARRDEGVWPTSDWF